jgi:hypothetical protein
MPKRECGCGAPSITQLGVEDLVAAVLGVGLGEHHQLDVGRVAAGLREGVDQVVDLVVGQRQAHLAVGGDQRGAAFANHIHRRQRLRRVVAEQGFGGVEVSSTDSVMRSWSSGSAAARSPLASTWKAVPRSMRVTAAKPHWRAISVAFDDQGEMVPRRGVTSLSVPAGAFPAGCAPSRSVRRSRSAAANGALSSTKYQCSAARPFSFGQGGLDVLGKAGKAGGGEGGGAAQLEDFGHGE